MRYRRLLGMCYIGNISNEMMRATHHHPYKIFDLINYYLHNHNLI
jgi:hypothetical protein